MEEYSSHREQAYKGVSLEHSEKVREVMGAWIIKNLLSFSVSEMGGVGEFGVELNK